MLHPGQSPRTRAASACALALLLACPALRAQSPHAPAFRVRSATLDLAIDYATQRLSGSMTYELENWTTRAASEVPFQLNRLMDVSRVVDGAGRRVAFTQDVVRGADEPVFQFTSVVVRLPRPVPPRARVTLRLAYGGSLVGYTERGWLYVHDHIDSAFTIIREDALAFPVVGGRSDSLDRQVPRVDFTYDASVRAPAHLLVASGGSVTRTAHDDGTTTWRYRSLGASPFLNLTIAPYDTIGAEGVHIFYFPADSDGARRLLGRTRAALDTLARWFGPLHASKDLTISEIPDGWGSQASLVGGIIQTAAAFRDPRSARELYHELTHLWNAPDTDKPSPRWNEGLASFLEDLLQERLDGWTGRPAADERLLNRLKDAVARDSAVRAVPFIDYGKHGMTDRSYTVGHAMFEILHEVVGDEDFDRIVGGWYQQHADGGTTRELARFAQAQTRVDLSAVFEDWMFTTRWTELVKQARSIEEIGRRYR